MKSFKLKDQPSGLLSKKNIEKNKLLMLSICNLLLKLSLILLDPERSVATQLLINSMPGKWDQEQILLNGLITTNYKDLFMELVTTR